MTAPSSSTPPKTWTPDPARWERGDWEFNPGDGPDDWKNDATKDAPWEDPKILRRRIGTAEELEAVADAIVRGYEITEAEHTPEGEPTGETRVIVGEVGDSEQSWSQSHGIGQHVVVEDLKALIEAVQDHTEVKLAKAETEGGEDANESQQRVLLRWLEDREGNEVPVDEEPTELRLWHAVIAQTATKDGDYVLRGLDIGVTFRPEARFVGDARFGNARFSGNAWFGRARFAGNARFMYARFAGVADFGSARIAGDAQFKMAHFAATAGFGGARLAGDAEFERVHFAGEARFGGTCFDAAAGFSEAWFDGSTKFSMSRFAGDAGFVGSRFAGEARFWGTCFNAAAEFSQVRFDGVAGFERARFAGNARFSETRFEGDTGFESASFDGVADFSAARFIRGSEVDYEEYIGTEVVSHEIGYEGVACFAGAHFTRAAVFDGTRFGAGADFDRTVFDETAHCRSARFWAKGSVSGDLRRVDIRAAGVMEDTWAEPFDEITSRSVSGVVTHRVRGVITAWARKALGSVGWTTVRSIGELSVLTRVSVVALILVPPLASAWPAIRAGLVGYNSAVSEASARFEDATEELHEAATALEGIEAIPGAEQLAGEQVQRLTETIGGVEHSIATWSDRFARMTVDNQNLPLSLALAFFAAAFVTIAQLIYQSRVPTLLRKHDEDSFVEWTHTRYPEGRPDRNDGLRRACDNLAAAARLSNRRHASLITHHGETVWMPPKERIDWFDDIEPRAETGEDGEGAANDAENGRQHPGADEARLAPANITYPEGYMPGAERARIALEEGAKAEYWMASREGLVGAWLCFVFYAIGLLGLLGILVVQGVHVLHAAGLV